MRKRSSKGLAERLRVEGGLAQADHPVQFMTAEQHGSFIKVPLEAIAPNPDQPRKHFDETALEELAKSVRANGVLQPIIVKHRGEGLFLLVAGERRYRAAKREGLLDIPAIVTTGDEQEIALIENVQRESLTPIEEAEALDALRTVKGYSHEELASVVGKSRVAVTELLSLNGLPAEVKLDCRAPDIATKTHLLQVLRERDREKQLALWSAIKAGRLSTKALRRTRSMSKRQGRPRLAVRSFQLENLDCVVTVRFGRTRATDEDYRNALLAAASRMMLAAE